MSVNTAAPSFFFGAMSPYSWFAAERLDAFLPQARWRGVLLFAVFKKHNRTSWGLTDGREQGMAECEERAAKHGLGPIRWPEKWPTSDLLIARAMTFADMQGELRPLALAAMRLAFREGGDLAERDVVLAAARRAGMDSSEVDVALEDPAVKQGLRETTDEALSAGVVGVPTVVVDGKAFWGDDQLEAAARAYTAAQGG